MGKHDDNGPLHVMFLSHLLSAE